MKEDDYVTWETSRNFVGSGTVFQLVDEKTIIVNTGNGGQSLVYVSIDDIL
mgnify:CR=1 FL=1